MNAGLITAVLLSAAMPLFAAASELEQNVIKYMPKTMQPNLPGKFKADEIIRQRRGHVDALKKFAPYILEEYSAIDKAMKWPADTYLNTRVFGIKKTAEKAPHFAGGNGAGVSVVPLGFLLIQNGEVRMLDLKNPASFEYASQDPVSKTFTAVNSLIDKGPELVLKIKDIISKPKTDEADETAEETETAE